MQQTNLSCFTLARRITDRSDNIEETLEGRISRCTLFSLALDKIFGQSFTDVSNGSIGYVY